MIIKNVLPRCFEVLLDGKKYEFPTGASMEVSEKVGEYILMLQPLLVEEKSVKIEGKPEVIKVKKDVVKNKKSRK